MPAELPVAALAVAGDRGVVGLVHLQADGAAAARERRRLGGLEQHRSPPRVRPSAARPRWNRAARPASAAGTARSRCRQAARSSSATITSAVGDLRKCCRLRRDRRSVAKTRCSSSISASRSPRSALRTRTSAAGAWARLEGIVTNRTPHNTSFARPRTGFPFVCSHDRTRGFRLTDGGGEVHAGSRHRAAESVGDEEDRRRLDEEFDPTAFEPVRARCDQRMRGRKSRAGIKRQKPHIPSRDAFSERKKVVIGACAPIHPRVGQRGPPG